MSSSFELSLRDIASIAQEFELLHEVIVPAQARWTVDSTLVPEITIKYLTYDTRNMREQSLLFIKGNFDPQYLQGLDTRGLVAYVAERDYSEYTSVPGVIVDDVYAAMARISAVFYGHPERELTILGITGTKGKTTTAFYTFALLQQATGNKVGLLSSESICIDGTTMLRSHLTTPESLDSLRMMREARDHGVTHMVMEVSSQGYKIGRLVGIHFASAAFLNISPDHISPIEHPTFENYLYCKRQIIRNTDQLVLNAQSDYFALLTEDAARNHVALTVCQTTVGEQNKGTDVKSMLSQLRERSGSPVQTIVHTDIAADRSHFTTEAIRMQSAAHTDDDAEPTVLANRAHLALPGKFDIENATVALALVHSVGIQLELEQANHVLATTTVSGRMERIPLGQQIDCIIDFAHNYLSTSSLIHEMLQEYANPYIIVVTGSTGGKALDRREGIIKACQEGARAVVLTTDDSNFEDPQAIAQEMQSYITDPELYSTFIEDRVEAIQFAIDQAFALRQGNSSLPALESTVQTQSERPILVLVIGKGSETRQRLLGKDAPYIGDRAAVESAVL